MPDTARDIESAHSRIGKAEEGIADLRRDVSEMTSAVKSLAESTGRLAADHRETRRDIATLTTAFYEGQSQTQSQLGRSGMVSVTWVFGAIISVLGLSLTIAGANMTFTALVTAPISKDVDESRQDATRQIIEVRDELKEHTRSNQQRLMRLEDHLLRRQNP